MPPRKAALAACLACALSAHSQDVTPREAMPVPEALPIEAPPSFLGGVQREGGLELVIRGSWSMDASLGATLSWTAPSWGLAASLPFPAFSQASDLDLSLVFAEGWALKASLSDDAPSNRYALAYKRHGGRGLVSEFSFGNADFPFFFGAGLPIGPSGPSSPGLGLALGDAQDSQDYGFKARAILRYEGTRTETRTYRGDKQILGQSMPATAFIRGRYFILPNRPAVSVDIYRRAPSGLLGSDGFTYASLSGAAISLSRGTVDFPAPLEEKTLVLVYPAPGSGDTVNLDPLGPAVRLYEPGLDNPLEILSRYPIPASMSGAEGLGAAVYERGGARLSEYGVRVQPQEGYAEIYRIGQADPYAVLALKPLAPIEPQLYDPRLPAGWLSGIEIRFEAAVSSQAYSIPSSAIPGSLVVRVNGRPEERYSLDSQTGEISFNIDIGPADLVSLEYAMPQASLEAGQLCAAAFAEFGSGALKAYAGIGLRQSLAFLWGDSEGRASPGFGSLLLGVQGRGGGFEGRMDLALQYGLADADGLFILPRDGFLDERIDAAETGWGRSSVPPGLSEVDRSPLIYRDYASADVWGNKTLGDIDLIPPPEAADPQARQGPYLTASASKGTLAVAEFDLDDANAWVGMQTRLDKAFAEAARGAGTLVLSLRYLPASGGTPTLRIELGALAERPGEADPSFEYPARTESIVVTNLDSAWRDIELPLDGLSAGSLYDVFSGRPSLRLRLSLSGAGCAGRLLVGGLSLRGATWIPGGAEAASLSASSQEEGTLGPRSAFPDDFGSAPAAWTIITISPALATGASCRLEFSPVDMGAYKYLDIYIRSSLPGADPVELHLLEGMDAALGYSFDPDSLGPGWRRIRIDSATGSAEGQGPDGSVFAVARLPAGRAPANLSGIRLDFGRAEAGNFDIMAFVLRQGRAQGMLRNEGMLVYQSPGPLLSLGGLDILGSLRASLREETSLGSTFSALADTGLELGLLGFMGIKAGLGISASSDQAGQVQARVSRASHVLSAQAPFGSISNSYSMDENGASALVLQGRLHYLDRAGLSAEAQASRASGEILRAWSLGAQASMGPEKLAALLALSAREPSIPKEIGRYFENWIQDYALLWPMVAGQNVQRGIEASIELGGTRREGSPSKDLSIKASSVRAPGIVPELNSMAEFAIEPLILLDRAGTLRLSPSYGRRASLCEVDEGKGFTDQFQAWVLAMSELPSLYAGLPIAEFWDDGFQADLAALEAEPLDARLSAKAGLKLERSPGLSILEALFPLSASYSLERLAWRTGGSYGDETHHIVKLGFGALDILGSGSPRPIFVSLSSDEWASSHALSIRSSGGDVVEAVYSMSLDCLLGLGGNDSLKARNDLRAGTGEESFYESASFSLRLGRPASEALSAARQALFGRPRQGSARERARLSMPLLEGLETGRLEAYSSFEGAISLTLLRSGGRSLSLPLGYRAGLAIEGDLDASVYAKIDPSFAWGGFYDSLRLAPSLGISISLNF